MHRSVDRGMERRTLKGIAHVSIDEKALKRGHVYATVICDSTSGAVLDVGEGRTKKGTSLCAAQEREEPYQISGRDFQGNPRSESGSQCCLTVT